ncbi:gamma-glutamyltransferase [Malaciobacter molluscorum LMG 25693]|uniref:Gamma-glutamyltransferase n=1 Tax=Malaciobacter molluscorum LMG 25693 TaxID=870501 RepID=A0A2G1DKE2_9BACT|nr:gamma-glutamyltransferase family protein [Malaciobacter molluscorum]AXX92541.1 gamma-glutamyltranspeptidase [Malaciobacter molluscorum LMG 25693]PHO18967.1 gamma-glutamyltransferase [Malaciobacter molluscorum LMG 25693]
MSNLPLTQKSKNAMVVSPHHAASDAGLEILKKGGNAIEATIAIASSLAIHYPHMTGIGGDAFWLIYDPEEGVSFIEGSGYSGFDVNMNLYKDLKTIPFRGKLAANSVAGAVSSWDLAYKKSKEIWQGKIDSSILVQEAVNSAYEGIVVTQSLHDTLKEKKNELIKDSCFAEIYYPNNEVPKIGELLVQEKLGKTIKILGEKGFDDFYKGNIAKDIADDFKVKEGLITKNDLEKHNAKWQKPLQVKTSNAKIFNASAPTQGVASLMIIGLFDRWVKKLPKKDSSDHIHLLVEATKIAFKHRNKMSTAATSQELQAWLEPAYLDKLSEEIDFQKAAPWGENTAPGDTTWFGAIDSKGRVVSAIQSIYHEFGSGFTLPKTGIVWQNRGCSFSLDSTHIQSLEPHKKPFHTLNPAIALFDDGRVMAYGTMGGDGQPQTQAAIFTRYAYYDEDLQTSINNPRWLLGRTWGNSSQSLKLESRFDDEIIEYLKQKGHDVEILGELDSAVGHAGALVYYPSKKILGAFDPRSDGKASNF